MSFEPIEWVLSTLTPWHFAAWLAFFGLSVPAMPKNKEPMPIYLRIWAGIVLLPIAYCMVGLVVGQLFGDKYSWARLWPSSFALATIVSTFFVVHLVPAIWLGRGRRGELLTLGFIAVSAAVVFFGLFFASAWWALPRMAGFGLIDFPKLSWGVQL